MPDKFFTHLHVHDEHSILDGYGTPEKYAERAKELGFKSLAITNHGTVSGAVKFQKACKDNGIQSIIGAELYIVPDISVHQRGEKRSHINILVSNSKGWENLLRLVTIGNTRGKYYRPRIDPNILLEHCEGLVVLSACASSFLFADFGESLLKSLLDKNIPVFLEVMPLNYEPQRKKNALAKTLADKYSLPIVATNDCHYIEKEDEKIQEVLLAIQSKKRWKDPTRWKFDVGGLYLKTRKEMIESFEFENIFTKAEIRKFLNNTQLVVDLCKDFEIKPQEVSLPAVPRLNGRDDEEVIRELCEEGLNRIGRKNDSVYRDRMVMELEIITKQKFSRYFLILWELIDWCENNDIMVGPGRGSAGGSLVCYLLKITKVDPIKFKLVFARFISPARIDLPDIDSDFEDAKRPLVRKHLEDIYGINNVSGVSTFLSLKGRGAVRDVSRVFEVPMADVGKACSSIVVRSGGDARSDYSIEDAFNTFEDGKRFAKKYPEVAKISMKLEGQIRGKGQHAAAIVISSDDLREGKRASLDVGKEGETIVAWDKYDIEYYGLMKLDVLGLNALTVLSDTKRLIKKNRNVDIDYLKIPLDDKKCFEEFTKGNNVGCFQVGSLGLRRFCQQIGVDDFMMLVHASSLYRPGTLRSGMTTEFVKRKKKEVEWEFQHPFLEKITGDTFGIILYQEQVMMFMYDLAGLGWKTADTVRKVISKSQGAEQFAKFKDLFIEGCKNKKTLDEATAGKLWDELASFGSYGFNLSHAVEYSLITYWDMWVKLNYPEEFLCASLTCGDAEKKEELIEEAFRLNIDVRPPKVGRSDSHRWTVQDGVLYAPFVEIKGIGEKTASSFLNLKIDSKEVMIEAEEKKPSKKGFYKKEDREKKKPVRKISSRFLNILDKIDAYSDIPMTEDKAGEISEFFSFSFSKDKLFKFRKLINRIEQAGGITPIKSLNFNEPDKNMKYFFGQMTVIKFGYRSALNTLDKKLEMAGTADNLGGVYGNFKDSTDFCMLVFGSEIYSRRKEEIEHCEGKLMYVKANIPNRAGSIHCKDVWFEEELQTCSFGKEAKLNLIKPKRFSDKEVKNCTLCEIDSKNKIPCVKGQNNILIVTDTPMTEGESYCDYFWKEMKKRVGFDSSFFNISSVIKCKTKEKIQAKHIKKCSVWLEKEIEKIEPVLIFVIGKNSLKFFTGEDKGIMEKSGTTEWSEKFGAWLCYGISPQSAYYHEENRELFNRSIDNFCEKIELLGGK